MRRCLHLGRALPALFLILLLFLPQPASAARVPDRRTAAPTGATDAALPTRTPYPTSTPLFGGAEPERTAPSPATQAVNASAGELLQALFGDDSGSTPVQIVLLLTILSVAPSLLILLTGFTRILIVLGFVRNAMGTQTMPPTQVLVGLSLFLTLFVMAPVFDRINEDAYQPLTQGEITQEEAIDRAVVPISEFMLKQTYKDDLTFFVKASGLTELKSPEDTPFRVLVPAFITSELKRAFTIGFMIYIPFIVIDMVVASTLMSMGMMMLPPSMIALPFKVAVFLLVDGWQLTIATLLQSFT